MSSPIDAKRLALGLLIVLLSALVVPAIFVVLARLGLPFGTGIVAMAEDYNWLLILSGKGLSQKAQNFWAINDRNPLSPWWYIAAEKLYAGRPNGPYLTRLLMQPLLGGSAFLMIVAASQGRAMALAVAVGVACATGIYAGAIDQINWNFLGAMSLSLLCVASFAMWLNSGRRQVGWYGAALFLWYCAFTSYSFQVGAIVGVALLSLLSRPEPAIGWLRRLCSAALEIGPFAALLVIFLLTWRTTQNPGFSDYYILQPSLLATNLPTSLAIGFSPFRYAPYATMVWHEYPWLTAALAAMLGGTLALILAFWRRPAAATLRDGLLLLAIAFGIVLPTALIESMSATWTVGLRWPMVDQGWLPLFWLGLAATLLALLPIGARGRRLAFAVFAGLAVAGLVAISLGYNRAQLRFAQLESAFSAGMKQVAAAAPAGPLNLVVLVSPGVTLSVPDVMSERIARVWFPGRDVGLRVLVPGAAAMEPGHERWWRVVFAEDRVENVRIGGKTSDYAALRVFRFDGRTLTPVTSLNAADVEGYPTVWQRSAPLALPR